MHAKLLQLCSSLCDPMDCVARQAPLSIGFSKQEYWSGLPFLSPGELPDPGIGPTSLAPSALAGGFFTTVPLGIKTFSSSNNTLEQLDLIGYIREINYVNL